MSRFWLWLLLSGCGSWAFGANTVPDIELVETGRISLPVSSAGQSQGLILDFALDEHDRFATLRLGATELTVDVEWLDAGGKHLGKLSLPSLAGVEDIRLLWLRGQRWLLVMPAGAERTRAHFLDLDSAVATPIEHWPGDPLRAIASADGGFFALMSKSNKRPVKSWLRAFDRDGQLRWERSDADVRSQNGLNAGRLAVLSSSEIAVLGTHGTELQLFNFEGEHLRDAELVLRRRSGLFDSFQGDRVGGIISYDSAGQPRVIHTNANGALVTQFDPGFRESSYYGVQGKMQLAADGSYWMTDGFQLLQLDERGKVTRRIGSGPEIDKLGRIAALAVTAAGDIYAADQRSAAVHHLDRLGKPVDICRPDPGDYQEDLAHPVLTVDDRGQVYMKRRNISALNSREADYLLYDPACRRLGVLALEPDDFQQIWVSQAGSRNRWVVGARGIYLYGPDHQLLSRYPSTDEPDEDFSFSNAVSAPDGSLLALALDAQKRARVTVLDPKGARIDQFEAPADVQWWPGGMAFDGQRLAFLIKPDQGRAAPSLLICDARGKPQMRVPVLPGHPASDIFWVHAPALELWLFDGHATISRFRVP